MNSLFLCRTPFQFNLIKKIIETEGVENYTIFYIVENEVNVDDYQGVILYKKRNVILDLLYFIRSLHQSTFSELYLASVNNYLFQLYYRFIFRGNLNTFDDGSANLSKTSFFYKGNGLKYKIKKIVVNDFLGCPTAYQLLEDSLYHYTIYNSNNSNNSNKYKKIALFDSDTSLNETLVGELTILLGSCFSELSCEPNLLIDSINKYMQRFNKYLYIKHPRNKMKVDTFYPIVNYPGMAEEFIIKMSRKFKVINVVGVFSSVHINMSHIENVKLIALESVLIHDNFQACNNVKEKYPMIEFLRVAN